MIAALLTVIIVGMRITDEMIVARHRVITDATTIVEGTTIGLRAGITDMMMITEKIEEIHPGESTKGKRLLV